MSTDLRLVRWPARDRAAMQTLAASLERLSRAVAASERRSPEPVARAPIIPPEQPSDADKARALLQQRRRRDATFGDHAVLFAEPAWDMLLTLFIDQEEGRSTRVADLVAAHAGSGGHWFRAIEAEGLVSRRRSAEGGDVAQLTPAARAVMLAYLEPL